MNEYTEDRYIIGDRKEIDKLTQKQWKSFSAFVEETFTKMLDSGWKNPEIVFESTNEPYEDYLGPVEVTFIGLRKKTEEEIEYEKEYWETERLASKLGITPYEAGILRRLQKQNKLGDLV